jgi:hypothetical protein
MGVLRQISSHRNNLTAVRILEKDATYCPQFVPVVKETRREFIIGEASAEKAYMSVETFEEIAGMGATAFIGFKSNNAGGGSVFSLDAFQCADRRNDVAGFCLFTTGVVGGVGWLTGGASNFRANCCTFPPVPDPAIRA